MADDESGLPVPPAVRVPCSPWHACKCCYIGESVPSVQAGAHSRFIAILGQLLLRWQVLNGEVREWERQVKIHIHMCTFIQASAIIVLVITWSSDYRRTSYDCTWLCKHRWGGVWKISKTTEFRRSSCRMAPKWRRLLTEIMMWLCWALVWRNASFLASCLLTAKRFVFSRCQSPYIYVYRSVCAMCLRVSVRAFLQAYAYMHAYCRRQSSRRVSVSKFRHIYAPHARSHTHTKWVLCFLHNSCYPWIATTLTYIYTYTYIYMCVYYIVYIYIYVWTYKRVYTCLYYRCYTWIATTTTEASQHPSISHRCVPYELTLHPKLLTLNRKPYNASRHSSIPRGVTRMNESSHTHE